MKILRLSFNVFLLLAVFLSPAALRAETPPPAAPAPAKLYVTIATFEPIAFNNLRHGRAQAGEILLSTLKDTAAASAKFAGLPDEIVVLDEDAKAPADAPVLRLTWTDGRGTVTADLTEHGKNHHLGVVSRHSMLSHPDHARLMRTLNSALPADVYRDATVRTETEMNLYFALKLIADRRARAAAK